MERLTVAQRAVNLTLPKFFYALFLRSHPHVEPAFHSAGPNSLERIGRFDTLDESLLALSQ